MKADRAKGKVLYKNQHIRFYPDLSPGVHKQQKRFDGVRQQLRDMGIQYGMLFPARLLVTHRERCYIFDTPARAEEFTERIKKEDGSGSYYKNKRRNF